MRWNREIGKDYNGPLSQCLVSFYDQCVEKCRTLEVPKEVMGQDGYRRKVTRVCLPYKPSKCLKKIIVPKGAKLYNYEYMDRAPGWDTFYTLDFEEEYKDIIIKEY